MVFYVKVPSNPYVGEGTEELSTAYVPLLK